MLQLWITTFRMWLTKLRFYYNYGCYLQVVPWCFRKLLNWIAKEYNNPPVLITENGLSDRGEINDGDRVNFYIVSYGTSDFVKDMPTCVSKLMCKYPYPKKILASRLSKPHVLFIIMFYQQRCTILLYVMVYAILQRTKL